MAGLIAGHGEAIPRHGSRRTDHQPQGRHRRRRHRRLAGDRGHRLGRPARARPGPEHPRAQPLVRHELDRQSYLDRSARLRGRAGLEEGHRGGGCGRQLGYQRGNGLDGLADPAYDPYVIAVGASDSMGTPTTKDDQVGGYSATACAGCRRPDFVAPGSASAGPPRAEFIPRRAAPRSPPRRPLLPRHRHLAGGGGRVGRDRARAAEVPEPLPRPRQALLRAPRRQAPRLRQPRTGRRVDPPGVDAGESPADLASRAEARQRRPAWARWSSHAARIT